MIKHILIKKTNKRPQTLHPDPIMLKEKKVFRNALVVVVTLVSGLSVLRKTWDKAMTISDAVDDISFYVNCCAGTGARLSGAHSLDSQQWARGLLVLEQKRILNKWDGRDNNHVIICAHAFRVRGSFEIFVALFLLRIFWNHEACFAHYEFLGILC